MLIICFVLKYHVFTEWCCEPTIKRIVHGRDKRTLAQNGMWVCSLNYVKMSDIQYKRVIILTRVNGVQRLLNVVPSSGHWCLKILSVDQKVNVIDLKKWNSTYGWENKKRKCFSVSLEQIGISLLATSVVDLLCSTNLVFKLEQIRTWRRKIDLTIYS